MDQNTECTDEIRISQGRSFKRTVDKIRTWYKLHSHQKLSARRETCGDKYDVISSPKNIYIYISADEKDETLYTGMV